MINVVIPMAGAGSRFAKVGYTKPKPLIEVGDKTLVQLSADSLMTKEAKFHFLVSKDHIVNYAVDNYLKEMYPDCEIIVVDKLTEGAACTVLLAKEYINNDTPIIIANSDQFIVWNGKYDFDADASILVFNDDNPKWSFAKVEHNYVVEVAEKNPISNIATVGVYIWKRGSDFVKYAEQMIEKDIRVNNEFYVCPIFNEAIADGKKITVSYIDEMWGLGTPEDLEIYKKFYLRSA